MVRETENSMALAFTLAEVLITLAVIGIVAALTLPSFIEKYQEKILITKLKKFYSELAFAHNMNIANEKTGFTSEDLLEYFKTYKICEHTYEGCADNTYVNVKNGRANWGKTDSFASTSNYAILQNGMILRYFSWGNTCSNDAGTGALKNACGEFSVDINGSQKPNQLGKDVFYFYVTQKGIVPFGTKEETRYPFETTCASPPGTSCAAWVLENENFDYLKCDDLSWNGKKTCE